MNPHLWNGEAGRLFAPVTLLGRVCVTRYIKGAQQAGVMMADSPAAASSPPSSPQ
jgi:hypothetical protein